METKNMGKRLPAFTLTELLVVLVIIGILVLLAPHRLIMISKAKSMEAQMQPGHIHSLEKGYNYMYSRYSTIAGEIGIEQEKLATEDGTANYLIEIVSADAAWFIVRATAVVDIDGDGNFNVW